jgi:beta-galactosidase/beta-glucuronidase
LTEIKASFDYAGPVALLSVYLDAVQPWSSEMPTRYRLITGKSPTVEDMRADLVLMKQNNINAVRAAHYPNDHHLLDLADELGFYLFEEANVECPA